MFIFLVLSFVAALSAAFSNPVLTQDQSTKNDDLARQFDIADGRNLGLYDVTPSYLKRLSRDVRQGGHFDPLLGHSFGSSKRSSSTSSAIGKRNFDEIDNAGFRDYLHKRNFDEIDGDNFRDHFYKRNFDEIDNAGFRDYLHKRNFDEIDNAGFTDYLSKRNFDEIDSAGFRDSLSKRNFDEIDNAGFRDHLFKRNFDEIDSAGFRDSFSKRPAKSMLRYRLLPLGMPLETKSRNKNQFARQ